MSRLHRTRLRTHDFWIDVRWASFGDCWIASADTPDGPTLGVGWTPHEALSTALEPFDGAKIDVISAKADDGRGEA